MTGDEARQGWRTLDHGIVKQGRYWLKGRGTGGGTFRLTDRVARPGVLVSAPAIPHLNHRGVIVAYGKAPSPERRDEAVSWWKNTHLVDLFTVPGILAALRGDPVGGEQDHVLHLLLCDDRPAEVMERIADLLHYKGGMGRWPAYSRRLRASGLPAVRQNQPARVRLRLQRLARRPVRDRSTAAASLWLHGPVGQLDGKVAVVIGASRGIGKGAAIEAALAGATVYATGRTLTAASSQSTEPGSLTETVAEITAAGGHAIPVRCDATSRRGPGAPLCAGALRTGPPRSVGAQCVQHRGHRTDDGAAILGAASQPLGRHRAGRSPRAAYISAVHAAPALIATEGGLIVHVSARGAARYRYNAAYGMDKAAIDKLTADLAHEFQPHGVAVVSLWPSVTRTERSRPTSGVERYRYPDPSRPVEELETPRYSGRAVVALASDPEVLARSGRRFWTAELAAAYGFTDEYGRSHPIPAEVPGPGSVSSPAGAATPTRSG